MEKRISKFVGLQSTEEAGIQTYKNFVHRVCILDAVRPFVTFQYAVVDEVSEIVPRIIRRSTDVFQKPIRLVNVNDKQLTPGLTGPDIELPATLIEHGEQLFHLK